MSNIFWGFLLVFLNFNISFGGGTLNLLPAFIGYYIIYKGVSELADRSASFTRVLPFLKALIVIRLIGFIFDLLGLNSSITALGYLATVAFTILDLYVSYTIVQGILELESFYNFDFLGRSLLTVWQVMAICQGLACILIFLPVLAILPIIVSFIAAVIFLVKLYGTKKQWELMRMRS